VSDSSPSEEEIIVQAPAKVNLCIRVLDSLPNGYHELWSLMHSVDVFDSLRIRLNPHHSRIQLTCENAALPVDQGNLVYRAVEGVLRRVEQSVGVDIVLQKAIPLAAGLGGGSSDAAAAIYGLNHVLNLGWGLSEMCEVGAELGSDIPFFFHTPCALVRGWGQEVSPCVIEGKRWVVLVNPGFPIETKWAYAQLASRRSVISPLAQWTQGVEATLQISWEEVIELMENDFELSLSSVYPILGFIKAKLRDLGAQAALLSGSGATVFGVFESPEHAQTASAQLRRDTQWHVFDAPMGASTLPHHSLQQETSAAVLPV
jgi:4-diphosphocytidyl-2-C-methyl-D-erythritol kinase